MKIGKEIFGRIWAVWGILWFVVTLFIVIIPIWITGNAKEPQRTEIFRKISVWWMRVFLTLIGCPLRVKGRAHFKKGEVYIVVCNHNSLMDVPLSTPFIPGANKTIAKTSMAKTPLFGSIYKRGSVLVDRNDKESRRKSYELMKRVLEQGMHMCLYPEGTRNKTGEPLKDFYDGAFRLAIDTKKAIIPALIFNTNKVLPNNKSFFLMPHPLAIHFLGPVPVTGHENVEELKQRIFHLMKDYYCRETQPS